MIPFSSNKLIPESAHLDIIKIMKSCLRDLASMASENALRKPAIGAFILSSLHPKRLNKQRNNLYVTLERVTKPPNLAQSNRVLLFSLKYISLVKKLFLQGS